jgi:hypothetical protein
VPRQSDLTNEQNERIREIVKAYMRAQKEAGEPGSQVMLAPRIGLVQSALSRFLDGGAGMTWGTLKRLSTVLGRPVWDLLGEEPPELEGPPRLIAVQLVKPFHVCQALIDQVLAEPETAENQSWPAIVWANHILALHFRSFGILDPQMLARFLKGKAASPEP